MQKISINIFKKILYDGYGFTIPGFGTFGTTLKDKRKSYNPIKNFFVILPVKRIISFHPSSFLKNLIKIKGWMMTTKIPYSILVETIAEEAGISRIAADNF